MRDPVCTTSGNSYEWKEIEQIVEKGGDDPMTWEKLTKNDLIENKKLWIAIEDFEKSYPFAWELKISEKELFLDNL